MKIRALGILWLAAICGSLIASADEPAAKPATPAPATAPAAGANPAAPVAATPPNGPLTDAQASYQIGLSLGEQLSKVGITPDALKTEELARGVRDALRGATMKPEVGAKVNDWVMAQHESLGKRNVVAAQKFLADNGKLPGIVTTSSGLEYKIVKPGAGTSPKPTDEVTVHYRGTLLNGSEFDSSYKRGQPAVFPVNGVIKGWQEALVLMKPGAKWKLYVPPALAYDMNDKPGIPPGSALVFDVELISVGAKP
ncbi:MAG TPA: FKBP-type peptidyl-prolyl cis-trans isomerase [Steroidobacteraceae bacterium]|nr:FKBP-type peptidyl-prolyl cis-trans isomerase [Steroidobacteraceae bacterium]